MKKYLILILIPVIMICGCTTNKDDEHLNTAITSQNPTICAEIGDQAKRDKCYFNISVGQKNQILCDMISHPEGEVVCHAVIKNDLTICDQLQDQDSTYVCYAFIAKFSQDTAICNKILDIDLRNTCLAWCWGYLKEIHQTHMVLDTGII